MASFALPALEVVLRQWLQSSYPLRGVSSDNLIEEKKTVEALRQSHSRLVVDLKKWLNGDAEKGTPGIRECIQENVYQEWLGERDEYFRCLEDE